MVNKKEKKQYATILLILVVGAMLWLNANMGAGRAGINTDFNNWYESNSKGVFIAGIFLLVVIVLWGFYEGKMDKSIRGMREQRKAQKEQFEMAIAADSMRRRQGGNQQ
jgi:hypothetical protein